jgi:hypothetical protein
MKAIKTSVPKGIHDSYSKTWREVLKNVSTSGAKPKQSQLELGLAVAIAARVAIPERLFAEALGFEWTSQKQTTRKKYAYPCRACYYFLQS